VAHDPQQELSRRRRSEMGAAQLELFPGVDLGLAGEG